MSDGQSCTWQVWTATADRGAPFERMLGTMMLLQTDGSVDRVTVRPDGTTDVMQVMPSL